MKTSRFAFSLGSALFVAQSLGLPTAHAETSDDQAQVWFREGRALMAQRRYPEACERFERSLRLEQAIGTQFNLADCWEKVGKKASAYALFEATASAAQSEGQDARASVARERAEVLAPQLSRLTITAESIAPGMQIASNDEALDAENWGRAMPIDPGSYEIRASAPGKVDWVVRISVQAEAADVALSVPELIDAPEKATKSSETVSRVARADRRRKRSSLPEGTPSKESAALTPRRAWGPVPVGLAALGVGGLAAGTLFALKYRSSNEEAEAICRDEPTCPEALIERHAELTDNARAARTGAVLSFSVGAAALAGAAITYFVTGPSSPERVGRLSAGPVYVPGQSFGLEARGAF